MLCKETKILGCIIFLSGNKQYSNGKNINHISLILLNNLSYQDTNSEITLKIPPHQPNKSSRKKGIYNFFF